MFSLRKEEEWRGRVVVYWLFGYAKLRLSRKRKRPDHSLRKASGWLVGKRRQLLSMLRSEGFIRHTVRFALKLVRTLRPRRFRLQCVIGLDDPADTGRLVAVIAPLRFLVGTATVDRYSDLAIRIAPDFSGARFTGYCRTSVQFVPLILIGMFLAFLFSAPVLLAAKAAIMSSRA